MNEQLQEFARASLKRDLALCTDDEQLLFKRMYSHEDLELPILEVVDKMDEERLDWAMQQVKRTLDKKNV